MPALLAALTAAAINFSPAAARLDPARAIRLADVPAANGPSSPLAGFAGEPSGGSRRLHGRVGASLYRSAREAGASPGAAQQLLRALADHNDLSDNLLPSDEFDLVVAPAGAADAKADVVVHAALRRDGKLRLELNRRTGDARLVEAPVARMDSGATPVDGRITSRFGWRRHPILGFARMHAGIDFAAAYGTAIRAASDGVVVFAGRHGGLGNYVRLVHDRATGTGYAHLSRIVVSPGMPVRRGEVIGYVGSTGLSTAPHLHYEVYRNGRAVNPASAELPGEPNGFEHS